MKINITIGLCIAIALLTAGSASAWLDTYTHRQSITLTGASDGAQTDYQINLTVPYDADMQADFDDVRFTQADGETLIDAWLESKTDSVGAAVWVQFPTTPANAVEQTYYMYYGDAAVASDWDGAATFPFFDDFSGTFAKWDTVNTPTITAGKAVLDDDDAIVAKSKFGYGYAFEAYTKANEQDIDLIAAMETTANENNKLSLTNNDVNPDDFDKYKMYTVEGGAWSQYDNDNWNNFRNVFRRYSIYRPAADDVTFVQDEHSARYTSGNIPTSDIGLSFRVWDSSQSSTLQADWGAVRKYVTNSSTYAFGSEEVPPPLSPPRITSHYNNITATRSHVPLPHGTAVMFNTTAADCSTWSWTLDGVDQTTPYDNYTHTFEAGFGYYAVTVTATNALSTDTYTWGIWENIETTAETIPTFTDTSYQMLLDSIDYPPDMEEFGKAMAHPFVQMVGVIFYLFIFGIPLLMMYIRQDNMTLPTTLLLLFGSIIIFMLPPQWQIIAGALMTLGFVGILFKLYKERER